MSDFFSAVAGGQNAPIHQPDDIKSFADAIQARFGQGDSNVLTARLINPIVRMPSTPMANLSLQPPMVLPVPSVASEYQAVPPSALSLWFDDPRTLVVDIRPHAAYSSARISRAVSLSVPSTLLKRPLFSLQRLSAMLPSHSARTRFSAWRSASRIIVYDADSASISETSNIQGLLRKFRAEAPDAPIDLAWVQGGFQAVWALRRDLVDVVPPTPETETETEDEDAQDDAPSDRDAPHRILRAHHLPRAAFALTSTTQAPTTRTGLHLNPNTAPATAAFNPFFDAVRQNTELSHGITERIPLRLPRRVRRRIPDLPFAWLRDIARRAASVSPPPASYHHQHPASYAQRRVDSSEDDSSDSSVSSGSRWGGPSRVEEGTEALAMQFYRIELAEQRRLMGVMEHHSREGDAANAGAASEPHYASSGAQTGDAERGHGQKQERKRARFPFSITAGVEKGSKNRYRNIWPFEHARVRLHAQAVERRRDHAHGGGAEGRGETQNQLERGFQLPQVPREELPPAADTYSDSDAEHDDYVNASYVQPLGTRRRYIATQGPLEATFGDFWTLVWQQNTRVIVMLTREIEGAAVKCGAYWLPGTYGPLRVELLGCAAEGCTGVCAACGGEGWGGAGAGASAGGGGGFFNSAPSAQKGAGEGGFFGSAQPYNANNSANFNTNTTFPHNNTLPSLPPTPPPGQLIRRTLRLTHAGHPRVPPRRVVQLQYLGWPDMNVPEDARGVLGLVWAVKKEVEGAALEGGEGAGADWGARTGGGEDAGAAHDGGEDGEGAHDAESDSDDSEVDAATGVLRRALRAGAAEAPVVLHCSAGVGRTGGFIAVDAVLDAVRREAREMYGGGGRAAGGVGLGLGSGSGLGVASRPGSGEGVAGISAHMRAAGLEAEAEAERMDVDVDVDVNVGAVDVYAEVGRGMRTPMQVDSAEGGLELRMGLGERPGSSGDGAGDADVDMGETRRWAERVADTRVLSAFSPAPIASFPSTTSSSRPSALSTTASFPPSTASSFPSTPFQFQAPTHPTAFSLTLPAMQRSLLNANTNTSADAAAAGNPDHHPQNPETKAASLPIIKPGALPLSVRRGYADYRLRTFSAPSAAGAPPAPLLSAPWLLPPGASTSASGSASGRVLSDSPLANSPLPDRLANSQPFAGGNSPFAGVSSPPRTGVNSPPRAVLNSPFPGINSPPRGVVNSPPRTFSNSPQPERPLARSLSPFRMPASSHRSIHSFDSADDNNNNNAQPRTAVDYKEPRALHGRGGARSPVRLSALEDPIWEVVQDMREQRMSLCQSLRQYVFVHAAIIEGALIVVDEERVRAGAAWRVPAPHARPRLLLRTSDETKSTSSSTGKRLASPTELLKEDKKGEIVLSKRPSIKRKQTNAEVAYAPPLPTYPPP